MSFEHKDQPARGAEPVAQLADATPAEQRLIHCIRVWMDAPDYQQQIWNALAVDLGVGEAKRLLRAFEAFMPSVAISLERQLYRHGACCPCLGRDEAALLIMIRHARVGDMFAAAGHAAAMVREDRIGPVVDAAGLLGHAMALDTETARHPLVALDQSLPAEKTLH